MFAHLSCSPRPINEVDLTLVPKNVQSKVNPKLTGAPASQKNEINRKVESNITSRELHIVWYVDGIYSRNLLEHEGSFCGIILSAFHRRQLLDILA